MDTIKPFGKSDKIGYALGDFGCNMSFVFINNYLMLFYVTCMKIRPEHFAIIILIAKIFDGINDPIIGGLCDATTPGKNGKFKPWIKWGSLPLLISSVLLFLYVPNANYGIKVAMCLGLYCIWSISYTSVNVPYGSMQSVITTNPNERNELSRWRSIGSTVAQLPIVIILPLIVYDAQDNPRGEYFIYIVAVMGIIGFVSFYFTRKLTTERVVSSSQPKQKFNYFATLGSFFKNTHMLGVTISSVAYIALIMTVSTSMPYVFMCYFNNTALISVAGILTAVPVILGIVIVKPALKKFTKKQLCTYPFIISVIASGIATFVRFSNPFVWLVLITLTMFGTSFYMVLMWALVADCIDYQEHKSGRREEGSIYATYSLFRKIAQGIGAAAVSFVIGLTGYNENLPALEQASGVPEKLYFVTGLLPFIGSILCLISMHFLYNIKDNHQKE